MVKPRIPENEEERIKALEEYQILDTLPEKDFDELTKMAAAICKTPISLITLIDSDRQWFKSTLGLDATETPRGMAFCAHAINTPQTPFIVSDASQDIRFQDNPYVTGDPNIVFYAGVPLNSPDGHAMGTLCVLDNKPHHLSTDQLEALQALANQVVTQMELRKKNRQLEELNREVSLLNNSLSEFSYRVSHDLKTPLRGINTVAEWLMEEYTSKLDEQGIHYLNLIKNRSHQLHHLIDSILLFSKTTTLNAKEVTSFDLSKLLEEVIDHCELPNHFKIQYPKEEFQVQSFQVGFYQILQNLITNSVKHTNRPDGELSIEFEALPNGFSIVAQDNGPGIPVAQREKVFQLFETLALNPYSKDGSLGVGLATVKALTEKMGGNVCITDRPDGKQGACFVFKFC